MTAGVSFSNHQDSFSAGRWACRDAVSLSGAPVLTLVFTTDSYDQEQVLSGVKSVVPHTLLAGFCCGGVITAEGVHTQGVGVLSLSGDFRATTTLEKGLAQDAFKVGERAGHKLLEKGIEGGTVIVMPDGFHGDLSEMLRGLYNRMGPGFQYMGGGAGDNLKFFRTYQFTEREISQDAMAVALVGGLHMGIGTGHGWFPTGNPLVITKASGKTVYEIDGFSAFTAYSGRLGLAGREQFSTEAMMHPLGFPNIHGQYVIRDPLNVNADDSINFVTEVPSQAVGSIMDCTCQGLIKAAEDAAGRALSQCPAPAFMLIFDCISRMMLMGDRFQDEIGILRETIGPDVPMLGALTFGEISGQGSVPLLHNKTTVVAVGNGMRS